LKILIFTDSFFPQINGLVIAVDTIANELSKKNDVYVVIPKNHIKKYSTKYKLISIPAAPFIFLPEYRVSSIFSFKILKLLLSTKFDVIHTHTFFSLGIMGLILGKIFKIPVIHTYHTYFEEYLHYIKLSPKTGGWIVKLISKWYCNLCDKIIVPSQMMRDVLISYGVKREIKVIPTGIEIKRFVKGNRNKWREKMNIPLNARVLLYVGRIAKEKNIFFLLECFRFVRKKVKDVYLLIVGDGPLRKDVMKYLNRFNLKNYVKITGYVNPIEIRDVYACGDIFVFASVTETQGLVILEAISAGLPVVAVAERGTKFTLPSKKILGISPVRLSKREMINEIIYYLKNLERHRSKIKQNLKNYIKKYTIQQTIKSITTLLKSTTSIY